MKQNRPNFAANIKRLRTFHGYSQEELAQALCISRQAYSAYERGVRLPDLMTAARIAAYYHTTVDCLLWAVDPVTYWKQAANRGYGVLNNVGQVICLSGSGAKLVQRYLKMSEKTRRELEAFAAFKEQYDGPS